MLGFWASMKALYGKRWTDEWGPEPHPLWRSELESMTPAEAAMGWRACRNSGDNWPPTLPVFVKRVTEALKAQRQRDDTYQALPSPEASPAVLDAWKRGKAEAGKAREDVDVARLERALGRKGVVRVQQMRRVVLRRMGHPAGEFGQPELSAARGWAKQAGRSWQDMELELMAYNGWTPDDEAKAQENMRMLRCMEPLDSGDRPFTAKWREAAES